MKKERTGENEQEQNMIAKKEGYTHHELQFDKKQQLPPPPPEKSVASCGWSPIMFCSLLRV